MRLLYLHGELGHFDGLEPAAEAGKIPIPAQQPCLRGCVASVLLGYCEYQSVTRGACAVRCVLTQNGPNRLPILSCDSAGPSI